jgi:hypothetical protein
MDGSRASLRGYRVTATIACAVDGMRGACWAVYGGEGGMSEPMTSLRKELELRFGYIQFGKRISRINA